MQEEKRIIVIDKIEKDLLVNYDISLDNDQDIVLRVRWMCDKELRRILKILDDCSFKTILLIQGYKQGIEIIIHEGLRKND